MTKKHKKSQSKLSKKKHQKQRQNLIIAGGAVVVIAVLALLALNNQTTGYAQRFDLDPIYGNPDAPVSIIEYSSYGCPSCRQVHQSGILDQLIEEYDGQVNLIFRDLPIIQPQYDFMTAQLAQCVLDQGNDLFWKYHDMLYTVAQPGVSTREELVANAAPLGIDTEALNDCYEAGTHAATVRYDEQRGLDLGIRGAPTFFINDERLFNFSPSAFREAIDRALKA